jgi:phosphoglycolate phosphatase-like HAD superfamily hydrolase
MTIKTILLDLDDTLLESNTNAFVAAYTQELFQALQPFISTPDEFRRIIWQSMAEMQANLDPTITNHQAFNRVFLSRLQGDEAAIMAAIDHFYKARYPTLQAITHVRPEAVPLVEALLRAGYQVVIATNPLYPQTAIEQRLDWAGVRHYPYALVTYMENSHFSKPNPAY